MCVSFMPREDREVETHKLRCLTVCDTEPFCEAEHPLVNGTTPIPDAYMTASTFWSSAEAPYLARLYNQDGTDHYGVWCSSYDNASFIQVSLVPLTFLIKQVPQPTQPYPTQPNLPQLRVAS